MNISFKINDKRAKRVEEAKKEEPVNEVTNDDKPVTLSVLGNDGQSLAVANDDKSGDKVAVGSDQTDKTAGLADQGSLGQSLVVTNDDIKEIITSIELPKVDEEPIRRKNPRQVLL